MGAGIAKEARDRFPRLDFELGMVISGMNWRGFPIYNLLVSPEWPQKKLGCFQVKRHWQDRADLFLIEQSTAVLEKFINKHKPKLVSLNFPGIGFGGLSRDLVLPIISVLPDCVHVWEYK
jgi:hypothetical protein